MTTLEQQIEAVERARGNYETNLRDLVSREDVPVHTALNDAAETLRGMGWRYDMENAPGDRSFIAAIAVHAANPLPPGSHHLRPGQFIRWEYAIIEAGCKGSDVEMETGFPPSAYNCWMPLPPAPLPQGEGA